MGTFAVQISKWLGAEVTGVCSARNVGLVQSLGADHVIDYTQEDFTQAESRYDIILDNVGSHSITDCGDTAAWACGASRPGVGDWCGRPHHVGWARGIIEALKPHTVGTYLNFPGMLEEGEQQLRLSFGSHYERLTRVKRRWDPDNLFRLNHDVPPAAEDA